MTHNPRNICGGPANIILGLARSLQQATNDKDKARVEALLARIDETLADYRGQMPGVVWRRIMTKREARERTRGNAAPHTGSVCEHEWRDVCDPAIGYWCDKCKIWKPREVAPGAW